MSNNSIIRTSLNITSNVFYHNLITQSLIKLVNFIDTKPPNAISITLKLIGSYFLICKSINLIPKLKNNMYIQLKSTAIVKSIISNRVKEVRNDIKNDLNKGLINEKLFLNLPQKGINNEELLEMLKGFKQKENKIVDKNKVSGCIYHNSINLDSFMTKVFPVYYRSNPLHPDVFPYIRKMEAEIIQMCGNLMNSNEPTAGSFTSGGTESILLACKTYRDMAHQRGITKPEIIVSKNSHASYWKAGQYFNIKIVEIDSYFDSDESMNSSYNLQTKLNKYFNKNTIAIIASAPAFNHGIIDPIPKIAKFVEQHNIYLHIDYCLGGFILPFIDEYCYDFRVPGVSSISMDTHKYGNGPKGGSVILYCSQELYKKQAFVKDDWSGGIYGTSNISGSRDGNAVALTWSTMMSLGHDGYVLNATKISNLTLKLQTELKKIKEIFVYGDPSTCIVGVGSAKINIYLLTDKLVDLGWNINILQNPSSFHFCITNSHNEETIASLIKDINDSVNIILQESNNTNKQVVKSIYGTTQKINDPEIIGDVIKEYICCLNELE
jgi:sphinganine-1-phosphate aldolase